MNRGWAAGTLPAAPSAAFWNVGRAGLFAGAGVLAALNAQAGQILNDLTYQNSFAGLAGLAGVSGVIWFAMFAALKIGLEGERQRCSKLDWWVVGAAVGMSILPAATAAKIALELCALYLIMTSGRTDDARRVGIVLLGLTGPLVWGRILLEAFARPLLELDAHLVGAVIGTPVNGNIVQFANSQHRFLIGMPCSSVHNISLALVLWTTAAALFRVRFDARYVSYGAAMVGFMFGLNIVRLSVIGLFPESFTFLHDGAGVDLFSWGALLGAGTIAFVGVGGAVARQQ